MFIQMIPRVYCNQVPKKVGIEVMESYIQALLNEHPLVQYVKVDKQEDKQHFKVTIVPKTPSSYINPKQIEQADQFKDQGLYRLPNGLRIAHQSALQTNIIYPEIFNAEVYLRHGITLSEGACVVDAGANIGLFTLFAYEKCHKNVRVYAFEPSPPTFNVLDKNVQILGMGDNIKTFCCGLSSESKRAPLVFFPYMSGMSGRFSNADKDKQVFIRGICKWLQEGASEQELMQFKKQLDESLEAAFSQSETYVCEFTTLSHMISQNHVECIDLLKIDVERCELEVLLGIQEDDWKKIRQIVAEVHNSCLLNQITDLLKQKGYGIVVEEEEETGVNRELSPDNEYRLYMVYAVRHTENGQMIEEEQQGIIYVTTKSPLLSVKDLRSFLQAEVSNYILLSDLRHLLRDKLPECASHIDLILEKPHILDDKDRALSGACDLVLA